MIKGVIESFHKGAKIFTRWLSIDHDGLIHTEYTIWKYNSINLIKRTSQWIIPKYYKRKSFRRGRYWNRSRMK